INTWEDTVKERYYTTKDGKEKKEGYYQTLISRRYSLDCQPEDDLLIFDKEFKIGYKDDVIKKIWIDSIKHTECDFVGINKQGDLVLLELKRWEDGSKIYLSPLQVGTYYKQVAAFMEKYGEDMGNAVIEMLEQKKRLGLIKPAWEQPRHLSGNVKLAVVVGCDPGNTHKRKEDMPSKEVKRRFIEVRDDVKNDIKQEITCFTCDNDGTLIEEIW
ncbi:MAG: hypothetical protein LUE27_02370, partial [Clostridia bacterium]|nr:hypothetical protein [Clostridia bacterium]